MSRKMDYERKQPRTSTEKNEEAAGLNDPRFKTIRKIQSKTEARRTTGPVKNSPCPKRKAKAIRELKKAKSDAERFEISYAYNLLEFEILQYKLKRRGPLPSSPKDNHAPKKTNTVNSDTETSIFAALAHGEQTADIVSLIARVSTKSIEAIMHRMSMQNRIARRRITPSDSSRRGFWMYSLIDKQK